MKYLDLSSWDPPLLWQEGEVSKQLAEKIVMMADVIDEILPNNDVDWALYDDKIDFQSYVEDMEKLEQECIKANVQVTWPLNRTPSFYLDDV